MRYLLDFTDSIQIEYLAMISGHLGYHVGGNISAVGLYPDGLKGFYGWPADARIEQLYQAWLDTDDAPERVRNEQGASRTSAPAQGAAVLVGRHRAINDSMSSRL